MKLNEEQMRAQMELVSAMQNSDGKVYIAMEEFFHQINKPAPIHPDVPVRRTYTDGTWGVFKARILERVDPTIKTEPLISTEAVKEWGIDFWAWDDDLTTRAEAKEWWERKVAHYEQTGET